MKLEIKHLETKNDLMDKVSVNNSEIRDDFELKQKLHQQNVMNNNFSVSSTIHFTGLDGKEILHKLGKLNHNWVNSLKSQSIMNVLDELNLNFFDKKNLMKQEKAKELSLILNEKSKLTVKKKIINVSQNKEGNAINSKNDFLSIISNNLHKNAQIESYALVNKSQKEKKYLSIEDEIHLKNGKYDATIHDATVKTTLEFFQENVFYHVDKFNVSYLNLYSSRKSGNYQIILEKMSTFNNTILPVWKKEIYEKVGNYSRPPNLPYKLEKDNIEWKNMSSISSNPKIFESDMNSYKFIKLGKLSDSSLIAALISVCNYEKKFDKRIITSLIYPQKDNDSIINKYGTYGVKIYLNGTYRYIEVDDLFPFDKLSEISLLSSSQSPDEFWFKILEKTFLFLYNFKKVPTNPSYEVYHLCGWLPECIMFDDISNKDNLWQRLHTNFIEGNIMVCLGTSNIKDPKEQVNDRIVISKTTSNYNIDKDLIENLSYSVLEVVELTEKKILKCKNPYGHTIPNNNFNLRIIKKYKRVQEELEIQKEEENGVFWLEWETVLKYFSYIYLAWNTYIYPYKYRFSSSIKQKKGTPFYDESISLEYNTQYLITIPEHKEDFEMRILLQRNIKSFEEISKKKISFKLFWYEGFPIVYPIDHLRSLPSNIREVNSDVFIFEASNQLEQYVLVILNCDENIKSSEEDYFTLDIFSFIDVFINEIPIREISSTLCITDKWSPKGKLAGDIQSTFFAYNPQFLLRLDTTSHIQFKLYAKGYNIMICIIEKESHVSKLPYDYVLSNKSPGFYNNNFSYFECVLEAGNYNVVCVSKYEVFIDNFTIEFSVIKNKKFPLGENIVLDPRRLELKNYLFTETVNGEWTSENNVGSLKTNVSNEIKMIMKNPGFVFFIDKKTKMRFILRSVKGKNQDFLNVSLVLYKINSSNKYDLIMNDDNYMSSPWGFFSNEVELEPNNKGYLLLCLCFVQTHYGKFELEINSDQMLKKIYSNEEFKKSKNNYDINGTWNENSSGGSPKHMSFIKNPIYLISSVSKKNRIIFELISKDNFYTGLALIEIKRDMIDQDLNKLLMNKNIVIEEKENFLDLEFDGEKLYYLIPFTDKPFLMGRFEIKFFSDEGIEIKEYVLKNQYSYYENELKLFDENSLKNISSLFSNKILKKANFNTYTLLNFNLNTSQQISLILKKNTRSPAKMSIIQIKEKRQYEILSEKEEDQSNEIKLNINLSKNEFGYLILILSSEKSLENFQILIESPEKIINLNDKYDI